MSTDLPASPVDKQRVNLKELVDTVLLSYCLIYSILTHLFRLCACFSFPLVNEGGVRQASNSCPDPGEPENGKRHGNDFRYNLFLDIALWPGIGAHCKNT